MYRVIPGYHPAEGVEYSVTVHPDRGRIYDVYPQCSSCGHPTYHECDAIGPADRIYSPASFEQTYWWLNAPLRKIGVG